MLIPIKLELELLETYWEVFLPAIENLMLQIYTNNSIEGKMKALEVSMNITSLIAEPLAGRVASAIDAYIHNISIYGMVITTGSPVTQTAYISSLYIPMVNGIVPNSLGIM